MRKKTLLIIFSLIFIIILIAINLQIIATRLITREKLESNLTELIGMPVKIGGITLHLLKGIEIDHFSVMDNNIKIIDAPKIRILYNKSEIIKGRLVIENIVINQPKLSISKEIFNSVKIRETNLLNIPHISIKNGEIDLVDPAIFKENYIMTMSDVNFNLYPFAETRYMIEGNINTGILGNWLIRSEFDALKNTGNLNIFANNITLKNSLAEILSPALKEVWNRYQAQGLFSIKINANYQLDKQQFFDFNVGLESHNATVYYSNFPYKVYNIKGSIDFSPSGIKILKLTGTNGLTKIALEGAISDIYADASYQLKISAEGAKFEDQLFDAIPKQFKEIWEKIKLTGSFDINGTITREYGKNKHEAYQIKLFPTNCSITPETFPYPITDINGEINYINNEINITSLSGYRNKSKLLFKGTITNNLVKNFIIEAQEIDITDYALRESLKKIIPGSEKIWETFQPEGKIGALIDIKNITHDFKNPELKVLLTFNKNKIKYGVDQYVFLNISGSAEYAQSNSAPTGKLKISGLSAENAETNYEINGEIENPINFSIITPTSPYLLKLKVTNLEISPFIPSVLSSDIIKPLKNLDYASLADIDVSVQSAPLKTAPDKFKLTYLTELKISRGNLNPGVSISDINGKIVVQGDIYESKNHSLGTINLSKINILGRSFENISSYFIYDGNRLSVYNLTGAGYQGSITGFFNIIMLDYSYIGHITYSGFDLKSFSQATLLEGKDISGKATFEIDIEGKEKDINMLRGDGYLNISNAQLWEVPVLLSIFNSFKFGEKSIFNTANLKFKIANKKIRVNSAKFTSPDILLKGKGTIDFDGNLDFQFDTKPYSKSIIPVEIMKNLVKLFSQPIYTIKIEGTFKNPKPVLKLLPYLDLGGSDD